VGELYFQSARKGPIKVMRLTTSMMDLPGVNLGVVDIFATVVKARRSVERVNRFVLC
jgi:hypothetical protein